MQLSGAKVELPSQRDLDHEDRRLVRTLLVVAEDQRVGEVYSVGGRDGGKGKGKVAA